MRKKSEKDRNREKWDVAAKLTKTAHTGALWEDNVKFIAAFDERKFRHKSFSMAATAEL